VAQPEARAYDFWRSLNINTHFSFGQSSYDAKAVQQVIDLGVAGVRDKLSVSADGEARHPGQLAAFRQLQAAGIKVHSTVGSLGDSRERVIDILDEVRRLGGARMFRSLGGVNEPDSGHALGWAEATVTHQRYLWEESADLRADGVDIVGPSLYDQGPSPKKDFAKLASLGIAKYVTHGNFHRYPKGIEPSNGLAERTTWSENAYGGKPTYATETGYNTGLHITNRGNAITKDVQATYTPRLFAEYFKAGVDSTFLYALLDDMSRPDSWERYWGQIRADGTLKPSYRALSFLTHLVKGASPSADTAPLRASLIPGDAETKYMNLDFGGKYLLLVWRDVRATDAETAPFEMRFEHRVRPTIHRPGRQTSRTLRNLTTHRVAIGTDLVVIELPGSELQTP